MLRPHPTLLLALVASGCLSSKIEAFCDGLGPCGETLASSSGTSTSSTSAADSSSDTSSSTTSDTTSSDDTSSGVATTETGAVDTTTTDATSGATTEPGPACGNGVVEPDEECDDGDHIPDNGCSDTCTADIRAFVSSADYKAGELMSLILADALCFNLALQADLPEPLRFKAFLSDSETDARDRFKGRGRIVLMNGLVFADGWDTLLAGELHGPLEVTEKSETFHGKIWTGTRPDGTAVPDTTHCADWSSSSPVDTAYYGYSDEVSGEWLLADQLDNPAGCPITFAIYCFETS